MQIEPSMSVSSQAYTLGDEREGDDFAGEGFAVDDHSTVADRHRIAKLMLATFVVGAGLGAIFLAPYFPWQIDPAGRRTGALIGGTLAMWALGVVGLFTTPRVGDLPERFFYMGLVTFALGFATATFIRQTGWHVSRAEAPIFARLVDGTLCFGGFVWVVSTATAAVGGGVEFFHRGVVRWWHLPSVAMLYVLYHVATGYTLPAVPLLPQ